MSDDLEQRLREALHAYADLVDAPDDDALPAPRGSPTGRCGGGGARSWRRPPSRRS